MLVKRLLLAVISLAIGFAATELIVYVGLQTTRAEYWVGPELPVNIPYYILTAVFIALGVAVWLDRAMGTEILPK